MISHQIQRQFILGRQGLWPGRRWSGLDGTDQALRDVEAVQIDPVSVVTQSHDLVLWGRVLDYEPDHLHSLLHQKRHFFDYGGALFIYPMAELPYWRIVMERQKSTKRWSEFAEANPSLIDAVRAEVRNRGPLRNRDLDGNPMGHYRASKDTGVALYYLWLTGELMTHHRHGKERVYDFLENVAPVHVQHHATEEEAEEYFTRKAIAHHGMVNARSFRSIWQSTLDRPVTAKEAQAKLLSMMESGDIAALGLEDHKDPHYILASDLPLLETLQTGDVPASWRPLADTTNDSVTFLSPLEYVSARGRAAKLFNFDYIWEIYKPAAKRKYGPYTLPILYGDQLVGRLDPKFDRQSQTLQINGYWIEEWFTPDDAYRTAFDKGLSDFAQFLGAEQVIGEGIEH